MNIKFLFFTRLLTQSFDDFEMGPQLKLDDIKALNINDFIKGGLEEIKRWKNLAVLEEAKASELATLIREKALGVFLSVRMVLDKDTIVDRRHNHP
jgi:hypothetical protein